MYWLLLLSITLAVQLPLNIFGKSIPPEKVSPFLIKNNLGAVLRTNEDDKDLSMKESLHKPATQLNDFASDELENYAVIKKSHTSPREEICEECCANRIFDSVYDLMKCMEDLTTVRRYRRAKLDIFGKDDLFMPVRGRRSKQTFKEITNEKKAKLDDITNDLFVPNRGRRQMYHKNAIRMSSNDIYPLLSKRNNGIEFNVKDYFVPNRGKRNHNIDKLFSEKTLIQGEKKINNQRSHMPVMKILLDPMQFQNIDDRNMNDLTFPEIKVFNDLSPSEFRPDSLPILRVEELPEEAPDLVVMNNPFLNNFPNLNF